MPLAVMTRTMKKIMVVMAMMTRMIIALMIGMKLATEMLLVTVDHVCDANDKDADDGDESGADDHAEKTATTMHNVVLAMTATKIVAVITVIVMVTAIIMTMTMTTTILMLTPRLRMMGVTVLMRKKEMTGPLAAPER